MFCSLLGEESLESGKIYRQNAEITPRPRMHNPPYDTGGTLTINPAIAKPMPQQIVINSPNLR